MCVARESTISCPSEYSRLDSFIASTTTAAANGLSDEIAHSTYMFGMIKGKQSSPQVKTLSRESLANGGGARWSKLGSNRDKPGHTSGCGHHHQSDTICLTSLPNLNSKRTLGVHPTR